MKVGKLTNVSGLKGETIAIFFMIKDRTIAKFQEMLKDETIVFFPIIKDRTIGFFLEVMKDEAIA